MPVRSDRADVDAPGVDPYGDRLAQSRSRLSDLDGGSDRPLRVVLVSLGNAEDRQKPIRQEPVDLTPKLEDRVHHNGQQSADAIGSPLWVQFLRRFDGAPGCP